MKKRSCKVFRPVAIVFSFFSPPSLSPISLFVLLLSLSLFFFHLASLEKVNLLTFLQENGGLDKIITEDAANISGGQKQRLALAVSLVADKDIYIFDEATSNIDVESENDIMAGIHRLAGRKTVILISHRLANVTKADNIYVLDHGHPAGQGTHEALLAQGGLYADLWNRQQALENYGKEAQ